MVINREVELGDVVTRHLALSISLATLAAAFVLLAHRQQAQADIWGQLTYPGWMGECVVRERQWNEATSSDICTREESREVHANGSYEEECNEESCDSHERFEMLSGEQAAEWPAEERHHWTDVMLLHWCNHGLSVHESHFVDDWMKHMCFPPP